MCNVCRTALLLISVQSVSQTPLPFYIQLYEERIVYDRRRSFCGYVRLEVPRVLIVYALQYTAICLYNHNLVLHWDFMFIFSIINNFAVATKKQNNNNITFIFSKSALVSCFSGVVYFVVVINMFYNAPIITSFNF